MDFRFNNHPQVLEGPKVRSYLSYVLQSPSGYNIGSFCVADNKPRIFSQQEKQLLIELGEIAQELINSYPSYNITHSDCATLRLTDT